MLELGAGEAGAGGCAWMCSSLQQGLWLSLWAPPTAGLRAEELLERVVLSPKSCSALLSRHQETWIPTGPALHPSAWGAARGSIRS